MFGNNTYWWAGLLVLVLFAAINVAVFLLRNKPKVSYTIAWCIACYLLCMKIGEYTYWQVIGLHYKFPVEFSALSYFFFGITVTFRLKKVQQFPLWAAFMAGTMYSVAFWIAPDSFVYNTDPPFWVWLAFCNHHLLYFGAMLMIANVTRLEAKAWWQQVVGGLACVGYSWIIYLFTDYANQVEKPLIIQMTDGSIMEFLGIHNLTALHYILYGVAVVILLAITMSGVFFLNNWQCKRRERLGIDVDYFPERWLTHYVDWE